MVMFVRIGNVVKLWVISNSQTLSADGAKSWRAANCRVLWPSPRSREPIKAILQLFAGKYSTSSFSPQDNGVLQLKQAILLVLPSYGTLPLGQHAHAHCTAWSELQSRATLTTSAIFVTKTNSTRSPAVANLMDYDRHLTVKLRKILHTGLVTST